MFKLETQRLIVRDMTFDDEDAFVSMSQDPKYQRFYDESDCDPDKYRELTRLFIEQIAEVPRQSYQLAVESKDSGKFIGTVCLRLEANNEASMGCAFSRQAQGGGLSLEAAKALLKFAFSALTIDRVYAQTISKNLAAVKLCKSLGMTKVAHYKAHRFFKSQCWDTIELAVLRTDWEQLNKK